MADNRGGARKGAGAKKKEQSLLLTQYARKFTQEAIDCAVNIMQNPKAKDNDKLSAVKIILDRGHGAVSNMNLKEIVEEVIKVGYADRN